jgi:hypothetical protein
MKDVRHPVVNRKTPDTRAYAFQGFGRRLPMQMEPRQSQVIAVPETRRRQFATMERSEEFLVVDVRGRNGDGNCLCPPLERSFSHNLLPMYRDSNTGG